MRGGYGGGGEIVEVQGGHIVRSTGRKDRHSKVCTAKGPRDRRVRLSAHTAIQFYDVQDRLGYDRPSKAVDWLINKAKAAIDRLDHLPAWTPPLPPPPPPPADHDRAATSAPPTDSAAAPPSNFLPPSLDSDAIANTIKSFFPVASGEQQTGSSGLQFHHHHHLQSQSQDLRLSLQSLQDPIFHHQHHHSHGHQSGEQAAMFSGAAAAASFGWSDHHHHGQSLFGSPQTAEYGRENSQLLFSSSSLQRGPLQSSNTPLVRANWIDSHHHHHQSLSIADHHIPHPIHHHHHQVAASSSSMPAGIGIGVGFAAGAFSGGGGGGFHHHFPARIQGEEEHHGGADKPSSASSDSRH